MRISASASAVMACMVLTAFHFVSVPDQATGDESAKTIQVFAAASTTNAIREIKRRFAAATGADVHASFGSSATLARQIVHGADADVFLSADAQWADHLTKNGWVVQKQDFLGNRLVIVVPNDSKLRVSKLEDIVSATITHVAMGEPKSVPAGIYAKKALEKLGLWEQLRPKIAAADDVRNALTYVENGAAEVGIVYATDAAISTKVKVVAEIPESLTGPIRYSVILLKRENNSATAESFYTFLHSPESLRVFRSYGFTILNEVSVADKSGK
jgi:molybdate transport system substrate-binding protein